MDLGQGEGAQPLDETRPRGWSLACKARGAVQLATTRPPDPAAWFEAAPAPFLPDAQPTAPAPGFTPTTGGDPGAMLALYGGLYDSSTTTTAKPKGPKRTATPKEMAKIQALIDQARKAESEARALSEEAEVLAALKDPRTAKRHACRSPRRIRSAARLGSSAAQVPG